MRERVAQVESDLSSWASRTPELDRNPAGTPLFALLELAYSYARRACDLARAVHVLQDRGQVVPAAVVARALIETTAMGCLFVHDMQRLIAAGDREKVEERLTKFYAGVQKRDIGPVHVHDAVRHLDKIHKSYFQDLSCRHKEFVEELGEEQPASIQPDVESDYALLCEVTHPNGTGTQLMYGEGGAEEAQAKVARRMIVISSSAIWQCHHIVRALENAATLPDVFREKFLERDC